MSALTSMTSMSRARRSVGLTYARVGSSVQGDSRLCLRGSAMMREGASALVSVEPRFASALDMCGVPRLRRRVGGFAGLARLVIEQQLSLKASDSIRARVESAAGGELSASSLSSVSDSSLSSAGLSRAKIATLRGVAEAEESGRLRFDRLVRMSDVAALDSLTSLKGIGPWTAETYLLTCLGRRDVFPSGDVALQSSAGALFGLSSAMDGRRLREFSLSWRPWRSVAALLLWSCYRASRRMGEES